MQGLLIGILAMFVSAFSFAGSTDDLREVQKRTTPVGQVQLEGDQAKETADKTAKVKATQEKAKEASTSTPNGKKIYSTYCSVCHQSGVAGAPKFRDKATWGERAEKSMKELVKSVSNGLNAMPPKGMCMDCSEKDFSAAIDYMKPKTKGQ